MLTVILVKWHKATASEAIAFMCIICICENLNTALLQVCVAVWLSSNVVGCINEVTLCRAGLVLRWGDG